MRPDDPIVKHWCLNLVVNFPVPLSLLFPVLRAEALNVKEIPGFGPEDYAAAIEALLGEQLIQLSGQGAPRASDFANTIKPLLRGLTAAPLWKTSVMPVKQTSFKLTSRGGAAWEKLADPDWNNLVVESSDLEFCELLSPNRNQLMAYMGWYGELHGQVIDLNTVKVTRRTKFHILYWKPLASVYHASFQLIPPTEGRESSKPTWSFAWFREWAALRWYRHPWELPDWPE